MSIPCPDTQPQNPPGDHGDCGDFLRRGMADMGCEVTISTTPPLVDGPYTTEPFVCPHGFVYFMEPTGEQIADWVRDGVQ